MKLKKIIVFLLTMTFFTGCGSVKGPEVSDKDDISYAPIVCRYISKASCWTILDCIPLYMEVKDDNTVDVYCSKNYDKVASGAAVTADDYLYGETFTITEEQKEDLITTLEENKFKKDEELELFRALDGSSYYISLYNSYGEIIQTIGGYEPNDERFDNIKTSIQSLVPYDAIREVHEKAEDVMKESLKEE